MNKAVSSVIAVIALMLSTGLHAKAESAPACRQGGSGRLLRFERVASYPTPTSARTYFYEWIAFYQDFYQFPPDLPVTFEYGFDSYKVTYCTTDAVLPASIRPEHQHARANQLHAMLVGKHLEHPAAKSLMVLPAVNLMVLPRVAK
jgi:hypothetical protein